MLMTTLGLSAFFTEFTSLLLLAPKTEGTSRPPITKRYCSLVSQFAPAQIRLPKQLYTVQFNTQSPYTATMRHAYTLASWIATVSPCPHVTVRVWRGADGTSAGKNASIPIGTDAARFLITSQTKSDLTARTDQRIISYFIQKVNCRLYIYRPTQFDIHEKIYLALFYVLFYAGQ